MYTYVGLPWWLSGKESACHCRRHTFGPWVGTIPWRRKWQPLQYSYLGNPMDSGLSPWGHKESHATELLNSSNDCGVI